jgi:hypothetical protein
MAMNFRRAKTGMPSVSVRWQVEEFDQFLRGFLSRLSSAEQALGLRKIAFDAVKLFMQKTPVDSGRARAGWLAAYNELSPAGGRGAPSSGPQAEGFRAGSVTLNLGGTRKSIVITNSVAYIMPLEYGWSDKAPYGMVRVTLQIISRQLAPAIAAELRALWKSEGAKTFSHWRSGALKGQGHLVFARKV